MNKFWHQIRNIFKIKSKTNKKHPDSLTGPLGELKLNCPTVDLINQLPNEMLTLILAQFEWSKLIHLRAVCARWQLVIESMGTTTRSLMVAQSVFDNHLEKRFFGHVNSQDFVMIKMRRLDCETRYDFGSFLFHIFPNIEQLAIESITPSQYILLDLWSTQLTTLSLFGLMSHENNLTDLATLIDSLTSLKQFDIERYSPKIFQMLSATLSRLNHFSYYCNLTSSHYSYNYSPIRHLGPNCTRLWLNDFFLSSTDVQQWHVLNPAWLVNLTHLSFMMKRGHDQVLQYLCKHCPMLQVLRLNGYQPPPVKLNCEMIMNLRKLTHLSELEHGPLELDLDKLELHARNGELHPLSTVRVCSLSIQCSGDGPLNLKRLKRVIDTIFPNAQHLNII